jgi:urease accessory protein
MRKNPVIRTMTWAIGAFFIPSLAHAHVGLARASGVLSGLLHPLTGIDHIAAMVAVGLWAAQLGGRALWTAPLSFMAAMSVGGVIGATGFPVSFIEPGIVASLLVLGLLVAAAVRLPVVMSSVLVGLFAVFHGCAHGVEMPVTASGLTYGIGFLFATGMLHGCGIVLGLLAQKTSRHHLIRYAGGAVVVSGMYQLFA